MPVQTKKSCTTVDGISRVSIEATKQTWSVRPAPEVSNMGNFLHISFNSNSAMMSTACWTWLPGIAVRVEGRKFMRMGVPPTFPIIQRTMECCRSRVGGGFSRTILFHDGVVHQSARGRPSSGKLKLPFGEKARFVNIRACRKRLLSKSFSPLHSGSTYWALS